MKESQLEKKEEKDNEKQAEFAYLTDSELAELINAAERDLVAPPPDLADQVLAQTKEIETEKIKEKTAKKTISLARYQRIKVQVIAACAAACLLLLAGQLLPKNWQNSLEFLESDKISQIAKQNQFTKKLNSTRIDLPDEKVKAERSK
ncbi:hypothetical protein [Lactobacillus porci]|jgi:hypothetical protein|uniref:Uncharacterized protein n=1 Tax=Lactobacillus porci TaxID=2012477 RepID=A0A6A8M942_9LACO|nr:hypothetical protein [Lactobacillus porci]MST86208.1 hypothetical protein [Lactobacillus porci]